jgi:aspartyl protease family protein
MSDRGILLPVLWRAARVLGFGIATALSVGLLPGQQAAPPAPVVHAAAARAHPAPRPKPRPTAQPARHEMSFPADQHGHFVINAVVNGDDVRFVLDTGASDVVLGIDTAKRLGFDPATLAFSRQYQTANGLAAGAPIVLREIRIGTLSLYDVPATVVRQPLPVALLGNSFLSRLSGHEVRDGRLTLYW